MQPPFPPPCRSPRCVRLAVAALVALVLPHQPVAAHPHEFVDARLTLRFDDAGALTAIGVEWRYDALTSMLILADLGLNPAAETLDEEETATLSGFDMNWVEDYEGDLWPRQDGTPIPLGGPVEGRAWLDAGEIVSHHWRPVLQPVDPASGPLSIKVYDPSYWIAYTIAAHAVFDGRTDCRSRLFGPDLSRAQAELQAALDELLAGGQDIEANFPAMGADFADELRIDCGPLLD